MPHDRDGKLLEVGDKVTVEFEVTEVHPNEEYCNVTLLTVEPMFPEDRRDSYTMNTKQVVKQDKGE